MITIPKENTRCSECVWSTYSKGNSILESGYVCQLNMFRSVRMGLSGVHSERKEKIREQKENRKGRGSK